MDRREFLSTVAAVPAIAAAGMAKTRGVKWQVGCFNRPWTRWSFDEQLDGVKAAGYRVTGLLSRTKQDLFINSDKPEYIAGLKQKLAARGLKANMGALSSRHGIPLEESMKEVHRQLDNAAFLKLEYVLSFGVDNPAQVDHYFKVMADAAAYAQKKKIKLVMKPHGGSSGSSEEILRSIEKVAHPNFKIWYDAGNIIHYTGKDPVAELKPIVKYVTGFCAKDCAEQKGEVMIQFGAGKVNFKAVFEELKGAGFRGPVMVECCAQSEARDTVTANARANREFLEKVLGEI
jgi:sugar phosphate isomerase/epimerase